MRRIIDCLKPSKYVQCVSHCLIAIIFSATVTTTYAVSMEPPKCEVIADECRWMDGSFQYCFDNFRIPDGEVLPIGAQIQVNCTKDMIACGAEILGKDKLFCVGPDQTNPRLNRMLYLPRTTTPNEVCNIYNSGVAKTPVSVVYDWCPKSLPH